MPRNGETKKRVSNLALITCGGIIMHFSNTVKYQSTDFILIMGSTWKNKSQEQSAVRRECHIFHQILTVWTDLYEGSQVKDDDWHFHLGIHHNSVERNGKTVNVDPIGFHNLRKSDHNSIVIKYNSNKMDKKGEKTPPKYCYTNPTKPIVSLFQGLGYYLCSPQHTSWAT